MKIYYLSGKRNLPELLDQEINFMTDYLVKLDSPEEAANEAYRVVITRYEDSKGAATKFLDILTTGWQDMLNSLGWKVTNQAYLLNLLLIRSGKFSENDIDRRLSFIWGLIPHAYLIVKTSDTTFINLDAWSAKYDLPIGDYAHGWHTGQRHKKNLSNLNI